MGVAGGSIHSSPYGYKEGGVGMLYSIYVYHDIPLHIPTLSRGYSDINRTCEHIDQCMCMH